MTDQKLTDLFMFEDIKTITTLAYDCLMALEYYEFSAGETGMVAKELGLPTSDLRVKLTAALVVINTLKVKVEKDLAGESRQQFIERVYAQAVKSGLETRKDEMIAEQKR